MPSCAALRVKIWMTPPTASEPYRLERGPRTTSIRSICSIGRFCSAADPEVAEPILTPSISTSRCLSWVPRNETEVDFPRPPLLTTLTPARVRSRSGTLVDWLRSISWRVSVLTEATAAAACSVRVAVMVDSASRKDSSARVRDGKTEQAPSSTYAVGVNAGLKITCELRRAYPHDLMSTTTDGERKRTEVRAHSHPPSARRTALECDRPVFGLVSWNRYSESRAFPCRSTVACCDFPSPTVAGAAPELLRESVRTGFPVSPPKAGAPEAGAQVRPRSEERRVGKEGRARW